MTNPSAEDGVTGVLLATAERVLRFNVDEGSSETTSGLEEHRPTCLATSGSTAWCGTKGGGVFRSGDGGRSWRQAGLDGEHVMSLVVSPVDESLVWVGTEPSALWRSEDGGASWDRRPGLDHP